SAHRRQRSARWSSISTHAYEATDPGVAAEAVLGPRSGLAARRPPGFAKQTLQFLPGPMHVAAGRGFRYPDDLRDVAERQVLVVAEGDCRPILGTELCHRAIEGAAQRLALDGIRLVGRSGFDDTLATPAGAE